MNKRIFFFLFVLLVTLAASADATITYNTRIDGVYYIFNADGTATVSCKYTKTEGSNTEYITSYSGNVVIPEDVEYKGTSYRVTEIGKFAFRDCVLDELTIPKSISRIDITSFSDSYIERLNASKDWFIEAIQSDAGYFERLTIPINLAHIAYLDDEPFDMKVLQIPEGVTRIGKECFYGNQIMREVRIPETVKEIAQHAFLACSYLERVSLPASCKTFGGGVFQACRHLTTVEGFNLDHIPSGIFNLCDELTSFTFSPQLESIGSSAFEGCSFEELVLGDNIKTIGAHAFINCKNLKRVILGKGIDTIGAEAFSNATSLKEVVIESGAIGNGAFSGCTKLTDLSLGSHVKNIGAMAFQNCPIAEVVIPDEVKSIGTAAFQHTSHTFPQRSIRIGKNVSSIGSKAFNFWASGEVEVESLIEAPFNFEDDVFTQYVYLDATLYVPEGLWSTYEKYEGWINFKHVQERKTSGVSISTAGTSPSLTAVSGGVRIAGVKAGMPVRVYDLDGRQLKQTVTTDGDNFLSLDYNKTCIVLVGNRQMKVMSGRSRLK